MPSEEASISTVVEKASSKLGVIVFKCLATMPDIEDHDGDIADEDSVEKAFYDFMANQPDTPVDIDHRFDVGGKIVAGWYFPEEKVFRVAFKPNDPVIVAKAEANGFAGSSFVGYVHREAI